MTAANLEAFIASTVSLLTAVSAILHSINTRKKIQK